MKLVSKVIPRITVMALALCSLTTLPAYGAALEVKIEKRRVVATGVVPGARVVFFSLGLHTDGYDSSVRRWATIVADEDRDGTATLDTSTDVPWQSIWIVVDLRNSQYSVTTPAGYPLRVIEPRSNAFRKRSTAIDAFLSERAFVDALYVSANGRAWAATAMDGYASDADQASDGRVLLATSQMEALDGGSEKPLEFAPAGLFFAIDISRMDVLAMRLNSAVLGGAR